MPHHESHTHKHYTKLYNTQKEEIIENMERRKGQLQHMLEESRDKLARHLAGEKVFEDDEVRNTAEWDNPKHTHTHVRTCHS